jgi:hypothetical protein
MDKESWSCLPHLFILRKHPVVSPKCLGYSVVGTHMEPSPRFSKLGLVESQLRFQMRKLWGWQKEESLVTCRDFLPLQPPRHLPWCPGLEGCPGPSWTDLCGHPHCWTTGKHTLETCEPPLQDAVEPAAPSPRAPRPDPPSLFPDIGAERDLGPKDPFTFIGALACPFPGTVPKEPGPSTPSRPACVLVGGLEALEKQQGSSGRTLVLSFPLAAAGVPKERHLPCAWGEETHSPDTAEDINPSSASSCPVLAPCSRWLKQD